MENIMQDVLSEMVELILLDWVLMSLASNQRRHPGQIWARISHRLPVRKHNYSRTDLASPPNNG